MLIYEAFLAELDQETPKTRKMLERVPEKKLSWKPHDKSMPLGRLATHVAELQGWAQVILAQEEFDLAPPDAPPYQPVVLESVSEIVKLFDSNVETLRGLLRSTSDAEFMKPWTLKMGGEALFSAPRVGVTREMLFNHLYHHRGQLSVYLRLNGVSVPQSYGPTADEPDMG